MMLPPALGGGRFPLVVQKEIVGLTLYMSSLRIGFFSCVSFPLPTLISLVDILYISLFPFLI
jgi:hypothetical protein